MVLNSINARTNIRWVTKPQFITTTTDPMHGAHSILTQTQMTVENKSHINLCKCTEKYKEKPWYKYFE